LLISNAASYTVVILDNSLVFRVTIPDAVLIQFDLLRMSNAASYTVVILDNSLVFRVTIPDAVLIQFDLLRMSKILLETCICRGL